MKRSPMPPRKKPMKRTAMKSAAKPPAKSPTVDPVWAEARAEARRRDGSCIARRFGIESACTGGLHVHHILPRSRGGKHDLANLATLCLGHHAYVHDHPKEAKSLGLLR